MIYLALFLHFIGDFVFQTRKMAENKSTSFKWLVNHIAAYSLALLPLGPVYALANGLAHFFVDAVSSRCTSYFYKKKNWYMFFMVIGIDQTIHTVILVMTLPLAGWRFYGEN